MILSLLDLTKNKLVFVVRLRVISLKPFLVKKGVTAMINNKLNIKSDILYYIIRNIMTVTPDIAVNASITLC